MLPSRAAAPQYDVFVSYRHCEPDMSFVRSQLVPALQAAGFCTCLDVECFVIGYPLILQMQTAVRESRYTLVVLSRAYLEGSFARAENVMATLPSSESRLIVLQLQTCDGSHLRERSRLWLDLTAETDFPAIVDRLAQELRNSP
jgi:hypothetical protein